MNEKNNEIYIHVGLHKTATTFLQEEIFPKLDGVKYYNLLKMKNRHFILTIPNKKGKILISDEDLSGQPWILNKKYNANMRKDIAYTLYTLFPDAKIIVGIRDKQSWYDSVFRQCKKMNPTITRNEFKRRFDKNYMDFEYYISLLKQLWGKNNVYIYRFEEIKRDATSCIKGICSFIGVESPSFENRIYNKGLSRGQEKIIDAIANIVRKIYLLFRKCIEGQK